MPAVATPNANDSIPFAETMPAKITAVAPVAPDIKPGLPPKIAVDKAMITAAHSPTCGAAPMSKANEIASGTKAIEIVRPDRISVFIC